MKHSQINGKSILITGREGPRVLDARVYIFAATALGRGRVISPTLGRLYPREILGTHFT